MDYTSLVLSHCRSISLRATEAKVLKKRCRQFADTLSSVGRLVQAYQQRSSSTTPPQAGRALQQLYTALLTGEDLVQKCVSKRGVNRSVFKSKFSSVESQISENMRVLATVPHVSRAAPVSRTPQFTVEMDDDSDNEGALVSYLGGAMASAAPRRTPFSPQPSVVSESVLIMENGILFYAECVSGRTGPLPR